MDLATSSLSPLWEARDVYRRDEKIVVKIFCKLSIICDSGGSIIR